MILIDMIAGLSLLLALLPLGQGILNLYLYRRPTAAPPLGNGNGPSPFGVWGALGTKHGGEPTGDF